MYVIVVIVVCRSLSKPPQRPLPLFHFNSQAPPSGTPFSRGGGVPNLGPAHKKASQAEFSAVWMAPHSNRKGFCCKHRLEQLPHFVCVQQKVGAFFTLQSSLLGALGIYTASILHLFCLFDCLFV